MRRTPVFTGLLSVLCLSAPSAFADRVVLRNGQVFDGVSRDAGDRVEIRVEWGLLAFPKNDIRSIERKVTPLETFESLHAKTDPADADALHRLGLWARTAGLENKARECFDAALAANPGHDGAHGALGHVRHDGRWATVEEVLQSKGYVRFEGGWRSPQEIDTILALRRDEERAAQEREAAERVRAAAEAETRLARARAEAAEAEAAASAPAWGYDSWGGTTWVSGSSSRSCGSRRSTPPTPVYPVRYSTIAGPRTTWTTEPPATQSNGADVGWVSVPGTPARLQVAQGHGGWTTSGVVEDDGWPRTSACPSASYSTGSVVGRVSVPGTPARRQTAQGRCGWTTSRAPADACRELNQ